MGCSTKIIPSSSNASTSIRRFIKIHQNGGCRQCGGEFDEDDAILANGSGRRRYYHLECARKLNII